MRKLLFALIALVFVLAGCGGGLKDKVAGKWKFDLNSITGQGITPEIKSNPQFKEAFDKMTLELKADGTYAATDPTGKNETGKWSLTEKKLTMTPDDPKSKDQPDLTVNDDGTKIHASMPTPAGKMELDLIKA